MTKNEQIQFVGELCCEIQYKIQGDVKNGKIPESWDGHELRQLISDRFSGACWLKKRYKDYKNYCLVNGI